MEEIWKDVVEYEALYQVSNLGRVKSLQRIDSNNHIVKEKIKKLSTDKDGYKCVFLSKGNKNIQYKVHRLVALAFIPNPDNLPQVGHKDESRDNNIVTNLEWTNSKENNNMPLRIARSIQSHKSQNKYGDNPRAIKVECDNIVFDCIKRCAEYYKVNDRTMQQWLSGINPMPQFFQEKGLKYALYRE